MEDFFFFFFSCRSHGRTQKQHIIGLKSGQGYTCHGHGVLCSIIKEKSFSMGSVFSTALALSVYNSSLVSVRSQRTCTVFDSYVYNSPGFLLDPTAFEAFDPKALV